MRGGPRNSLHVRSTNRSVVLRQIYFDSPTSRLRLSQQCGLSPATVTTLVNQLIERGVVIESGVEESGGGRPRTLLEPNAGYAYLAGITIRAWYVYIELFDLMLGSLARADFTFDPASASVPQVLDRVGSELDALLARAGVERSRVLGAGVGISATVDPSSGRVLYAPLIGWPDQLPLGALLADRLRMPVYIENGARSVVFAEALERARHRLSSLATLMVGHALGAGIMLNGELYQGFTSSAGLWAHMSIVPGGRRCRCGNQGCLDTYIGAPGIIRTYHELGAGAPLPEGDEYAAIAALVERARAGKQQAADALHQTAEFLGLGVANFFNLIDPELVVIGGRTGTMIAEYLIDDLREVVARHIHLKPFDPSRIAVSALGVAALTKGPAALVLDRFLQSSGSLPAGRSGLAQ